MGRAVEQLCFEIEGLRAQSIFESQPFFSVGRECFSQTSQQRELRSLLQQKLNQGS